MATLTPVQVAGNGTAVTFVAASGGGDVVAVGAKQGVALRVKNGGGSSINVTLTGAITCSQGGLHDVVVAVAAGVEKDIKLPPQCVAADTGHVAVAYSGVTTVTVAATY